MSTYFHPFALPEDAERHQEGTHHHTEHPHEHEIERWYDEGGPAIPEKEN